MSDSYIYIVDSKLMSYNELQRGSAITNVFNTLARDLKSLKKRGKIYITFDIGHSSFREGEQSYYKGHRREAFLKKSQADQDAHKKFNEDYLKLVGLFRLLDVTVVAVEGVEADDLASLIALRHTEDSIVFLSADFDWLHSVVGTTNTMYSARARTHFDHEYSFLTYGTKNRREFSVLKAILGDQGDNLKAFRNLGPVKASGLFKKIYDDHANPSDATIISYVEDYVENSKSVVIHEKHIEAGRTTVKEVFESNMKVGATFLDYEFMTKEQIKEYEECLEAPRLKGSFEAKSLELLGYPVFLGEQAKRIYNVT